ncbi:MULTISPECIES: TetR/AcrR family transcriptional regulator [unclassified Mycobacterium]|uniref:TetR/AcrR family transcriptional regulator n=1 Tax=unclassified Mycobacterium TaxID=2642494 RepID=UPI0029C6B065|nr:MULTISPECIES: TetR/AcrR family transcriptional regulator [unclassified Mycobacterium]
MTEPRRTQEERRVEAEQRLLAAAAELIGELGPSGVTLANIGERAGYSRGLATHHFGSKGAMMQRLVDSVTVEFRREVFAESVSDSALDEAMGLVSAYFQALSHPKPASRARLMLWADAVATGSPDVRPSMVASDREFRDELAKRIERGVSSGEIARSIDPGGLAAVVVGMLRGVALQSMLDDELDLDACRAEVEEVLRSRVLP